MTVHMNASPYENQARLLRCVGEPTRLLILKLLSSGELSVGEITERVGREQSLISHHLRVLKECSIVEARQDAQRVYYRLADRRLVEALAAFESVAAGLPPCGDPGCCR